VSAGEGVLRRPPGADEESVSLHQDVTLEQTRADGEQIRMVTPLLRLYPRRQYAETEQDVMIESLFGRTTSVGLEGDLQLGVLKFFSTDDRPVRTVLQPEQFK
jgi:lipopolysaccharide export system protein LptC